MNETFSKPALMPRLLSQIIAVFLSPAQLVRSLHDSTGKTQDAMLLAGIAMISNSLIHWLLTGETANSFFRLYYLAGMTLIYVLILHILAALLLEARVGIVTTLTAVCYALTPAALLSIPYLGYAALSWFYVLIFLSARELHHASNGQALIILILFALSGLALESTLAVAGLVL